jgi:hypothetical protein
VTSGRITDAKEYATNAFLWENLAKFVLMFETQSYCELEVPNAVVPLF